MTKLNDVKQRIEAAELLIQQAKGELREEIGGVLFSADEEAWHDKLRVGGELSFDRAEMQSIADFIARMFGIVGRVEA